MKKRIKVIAKATKVQVKNRYEETVYNLKPKYLDIEDSIYCITFLSLIRDVRQEHDLDKHVQDYFYKSTQVFFV